MTARLRLFCLPYAGGSARVFDGWSSELPSWVDVYPIDLPGRGLRFDEPPLTRLEPLVDDLLGLVLRNLDLPYAMFGHSLGGLLGYELCRRLAADYDTPLHLFVSGIRAPDSPADPTPASTLPDELLREHIGALGGTPPELLHNAELMRVMLPVLRADFTVADTYRHQPGPRLSCPVTAFGSPADPEVSVGQLRGWARTTTDRFTVRVLPGDHFFLHTARAQLLRLVAEALGDVRDTPPGSTVRDGHDSAPVKQGGPSA